MLLDCIFVRLKNIMINHSTRIQIHNPRRAIPVTSSITMKKNEDTFSMYNNHSVYHFLNEFIFEINFVTWTLNGLVIIPIRTMSITSSTSNKNSLSVYNNVMSPPLGIFKNLVTPHVVLIILITVAPIVEVLRVANGVVLERDRLRWRAVNALALVHYLAYELPQLPAPVVDFLMARHVDTWVFFVHGYAWRWHTAGEVGWPPVDYIAATHSWIGMVGVVMKGLFVVWVLVSLFVGLMEVFFVTLY